MEIVSVLTLVSSIVALIVCFVTLSKVNKVLDNLHTPIVKKLTPDMNLRPNSRRAVNAQEMAARGERGNKEARNNKGGQAKENRSNAQGANRERPRRERREKRPFNAPVQPVANETAPVTPAPVEAPVQEVAEARRPLAPRIPVETPAAPVAVETPVVPPTPVAPAPAPTPVVEPAAPAVEPEATFDPAKVRYGRRNVIKKLPELSDDE